MSRGTQHFSFPLLLFLLVREVVTSANFSTWDRDEVSRPFTFDRRIQPALNWPWIRRTSEVIIRPAIWLRSGPGTRLDRSFGNGSFWNFLLHQWCFFIYCLCYKYLLAKGCLQARVASQLRRRLISPTRFSLHLLFLLDPFRFRSSIFDTPNDLVRLFDVNSHGPLSTEEEFD